MKVLIVNTNERKGGAAVAARRLLEALNNNGVKAKMLVMEKQSNTPTVIACGGRLMGEVHFLWERLVIWANNLFSRRHLFAVSIANAGTDITRLPEFHEADIIHLHWFNQGFLSLHSLQRILDSGKPVVWTMHDMWAATAICHHSHDCQRFEDTCRQCPFLRFPSSHDLSYRVFKRKQQLLQGRKVHFVAVSQWLEQRAHCSAIIDQQSICVIPNAIALHHFPLTERLEARQLLGIKEPYVLVFGAARIDDPIKGFSYLLQALQRLLDNGNFRPDELRLQLFGGIKQEQKLAEIPIPYTYYGYVKDEKRLAQLYSASNVVVSSSLYETFGQTLIEAQACGCLPVAFGGSGQEDIIRHRENGYLAERLSVESLTDGLVWALHADIPVQQLRIGVTQRFSEAVVAHSYIKLYEEIERKD